MDIPSELIVLLDKAYKDAGLYYIGVYVKDTEVISRTSSKLEKLKINFGRLIEKSLELNDIIPNFREEFLFSEGKDYSIFVYYVDNDISIGMIHLGKPNFSMLKVVSGDLAIHLKKFVKDLQAIYDEKIKSIEQENIQLKAPEQHPSEHIEEKFSELESVLMSSDTIKREEKSSGDDFIEKEIKEKGEVLTYESPSLEEILSEEKMEEVAQDYQAPTLEDILSESREETSVGSINLEDILEKIQNEYIKSIGPFGRFIFKKKKEEYFKKKDITKFEILKFIQILAEEISVTKRKEEFIDNAKSLLINM